jgi:outer membrane immunogenic protein
VRHCWTVVFSSFATLAFAEIGSAADLPAAPVNPPAVVAAPDWSAFYLGIEGGGGIGSSDRHFFIGTSTGNFEVDGAIAGGTVGYNKQWGNLVGGLEGDFHGAALTAERVVQIAHSPAKPTPRGWRP